MSSDRARVTYNPGRRYHGVIAQQGRVSLEADWNEAEAIGNAELAARTLDLVGPLGSPDDGYRIEPLTDEHDAASGDFLVSRGALYVGGQRLSAHRDTSYSHQTDWLDHEGDPLWREPAIPEEPRELIYLLVREQEVSAVEDPDLRDVALGGPDTAQRLHMIQRVIRSPTEAATWQDSWASLLEERRVRDGFRADHHSHSLEPAARLQVMGYPVDGEEQPVDQGTYLGPNNQLIRIQICRVDEDGVPVLVWGYDNASFMYRLTSADADPGADTTTVRLATPPVDAYHQPAEGQAVEVLRSAASLGGCSFVAASAGAVAKVSTAYNPDSREVVIGKSLPAEYQRKPEQGPPLFLRIWQDEIRCKPGEEHALGRTGLRVRLTAPDDEHASRFPVGAYWMIAVRPGVGQGWPGLIYPQPILDQPQPPDGPRQWLAPIAFVTWHPRTPDAQDCVPRFDSAARAGSAGRRWMIQITPADVGGGWALQDVLDSYASRDHPLTVCLGPGTYSLPRPLHVGPQHGELTVRALWPGTVLRADPEAAQRFSLGLIVATEAHGFCLDGLELRPAHTSLVLDQDVFQNLPERARLMLDQHRRHAISIGLHAIRCSGLVIRNCRFVFSPPAPARSDASGRSADRELFGAGIVGTEELRGLTVAHCTFTASEPMSHARHDRDGAGGPGRSHHVTIGFAQTPTAMAAPAQARDGGPDVSPRGSVSVPLLTDAVFDDNLFEHLTAPVLAVGQLGELRLERNTARDCQAGFWLVTQHATHVLTLLDRLVNQVSDAYRQLVSAHLTALAEPLVFYTTVLARTLPHELPVDFDAAVEPRRLEPPSTNDNREADELFAQLSMPVGRSDGLSAAEERDIRQRRFQLLGRARGTRRQGDAAAAPPESALRCRVLITENSVESGDAPALVFLDSAPGSSASLILTGNQLRSDSGPGAAACLYLLNACAAAANLIVNAGHESVASLVVLPRRDDGRQTAITGNVLVGRAHLPRRPDGLPEWEALNSITQR
jgi:hypothetical protein